MTTQTAMELILPHISDSLALGLFDHNSLVTGRSRVGKTAYCLNNDAIPHIESREGAVVILDPHDAYADHINKFCALMGYRTVHVCDNYGRTDLVSSPGIIERSTAVTELDREFENLRTANELMYALAMDRKDSIDTQPMNKRFTLLAIKAWLFNRHDIPLWMLPWALRPDSEFFDRIYSGVTDQSVRYELQRLKAMLKNPKLLSEHVGGADRLISERWDQLVFKLRTIPTYALEQAIREKMVIVIAGGRADHKTKTMMMRLLNFRILSLVADNWARTQTRLPVRIYRDEDANYGLTGLEESKGLVENLKMGLSVCISTQVPDWADEQINQNVLQGCAEKIWLRSQPPVSDLAATYMRASLNEYAIHHTDETIREVKIGEQIQARKGESKSSDGKKTKSTNFVVVPKTEQIKEYRHSYKTLTDQSLMKAVRVEQLPIGTAIRTDGVSVTEFTFPDYVDYGVFPGYADDQLAQHMHELESKGLLRRPSPLDFEMPWNNNTPPPSDGKAPWNKGGTAMS